MTTVEALKELAAKVCKVPADKINGSTVPEIIMYIAENYPTAGE